MRLLVELLLYDLVELAVIGYYARKRGLMSSGKRYVASQ
jgi:hypothetical protein